MRRNSESTEGGAPTHWMCTNCGYYLRGVSPPGHCPSCEHTCAFSDVTCYRPECGGEENIDPLLVGLTVRARSRARVPVAAGPVRTRELPLLYMEALPPSDVFGSLTEEQKRRVRSLGHTETYEADAIICRQGAEASRLCLVEEGQVAVEYESPDGTRVPVTIVSPGGAFGWSALVQPHEFSATVMAVSRTSVLAIEREPLSALMRADPEMGLAMVQDIASIAASRLRRLQLEMIGLTQTNRY
jgi:CRP-like cAMP-binding protein/rubredoxin